MHARFGLVLFCGLLATAAACVSVQARSTPKCPDCAGRAAAIAGVFAPPGGADYVGTLQNQDGSKLRRRKLVRSGDWVRITEVEKEIRQDQWIRQGSPAWVTLSNNPIAHRKSLSISLDAPMAQDFSSRRTGRTEIVAGQHCRVWDVLRSKETAGPGQKRTALLSCVTSDGVQLWSKFTGTYGYDQQSRTFNITRRTTPLRDVTPPAGMFELGNWLTPAQVLTASASSGARDAEVVLGAINARMVVRRRGDWLYEERGGALWWTIYRRPGLTFTLSISANENGNPSRLGINSSAETWTDIGGPPVALERPAEVVLGERCTWFNVTPNVYDANRAECRSMDGLPLIISESSRGRGSSYRAVELRRHPQKLADILPPRRLLQSRTWGLPR